MKSEVEEEEEVAMEDQTTEEDEVKVEGDAYEAAVKGFGEVQAEVVRRW